jgi:hypothetical protein
LLDLFERGDGLSRQIVTAVRFGVSSCRHFASVELARELQDVDRIDIETASLNELLQICTSRNNSIAPRRKAVGRIAARLRRPVASGCARIFRRSPDRSRR